jgi:hypothetical protein
MDERVLLESDETSFWLKEVIVNTRSRDAVDCLNDIELLRLILEHRINYSALTVENSHHKEGTSNLNNGNIRYNIQPKCVF